MPTPKEIEFYVDEEQFLTFARAIKKGFRASELGWVEMEVKDGKMTLSTAKAGSVLACIGRGTVIGRVAMGNLAKLATAHLHPAPRAPGIARRQPAERRPLRHLARRLAGGALGRAGAPGKAPRLGLRQPLCHRPPPAAASGHRGLARRPAAGQSRQAESAV